MSDRGGIFERLWRRPQSVWARKALFQIHLWSGIGIGIYLIVISVSGSFVVFRTELHKMFNHPPPSVVVAGEPLSEEKLKAAAERAHPNFTVTNVWPSKKPTDAVEVWLSPTTHGNAVHHLFDPYTGKDLGPPDPAMVRFILWSVSLHDDLLFGETGRMVNGFGAILLTLLCATGLIIWWPGISTWRRSLTVDLKANWKLFNWNLHNAVGFWSFLLVLMWGISGIYLAFPNPFQAIVERWQPIENYAATDTRSGDEILRWLTRLHFGRFGGWPVKALWTALGMIPLILFITGAVMWWNRVLRPAMQRSQRDLKPEPTYETVP